MNMPRISLAFGSVLVALGVIAYFASGAQSVTALIPSFFGAVLVLCGIVGLAAPGARMHVMHVAALVGLLGTGGGLGMSVPKLLSGAELARPMATYMQLTLGVISLVFLALCVKSFIDARRARKAV